MNIPLTDIHTSGSSYLNTLPMVNNYNVVALVLAKFTCQESPQTINYSSTGKCIAT